jgi:hypothetical protein
VGVYRRYARDRIVELRDAGRELDADEIVDYLRALDRRQLEEVHEPMWPGLIEAIEQAVEEEVAAPADQPRPPIFSTQDEDQEEADGDE